MTDKLVCYKCGAPSTRGTGRHQVCEMHWQEYLDSLCEERIYAGRGFDHNCEHTYKVIRDGIKYCTQHDPVRIAAKREARNKAWTEARAAIDKAYTEAVQKQARDKHRLDTWEGLLEACKVTLFVMCSLGVGDHAPKLLKEAIALAEKED